MSAAERSRQLSALGLVQWQWRAELSEPAADAMPAAASATRLALISASGWLFVAEASDGAAGPLPFGDAATRLFERMLAAIGLADHETSFASLAGGGVAAGIAQRAPSVVVLMGPAAAQGVLGSDQELARLRQGVLRIASGNAQVPVIVTHHPAHLLRHLADKAEAWADLNRAADAALDALASP
ncbi:hypothetical protein BH09PSE6_BH09PSE6_14480 [soil metagenome]